MFKLFLILLISFHLCLTQDIQNGTDSKENEVNAEDKPLKEKILPKEEIPEVNKPNKEEEEKNIQPNVDKPEPELPLPPNVENEKNLCGKEGVEGYHKCKTQFKELTNGEENPRKICCAVKTLQMCALPVLNKHCPLSAFNDIEAELHGINHICRIIGSRYCPRVETRVGIRN